MGTTDERARAAAAGERAHWDEFRRSGDRAAFDEIVRSFRAQVRGTCGRVMGGRDDVEDAVQETFLVLLRRGRELSDDVPLDAWLRHTAINCARTQLRSMRRRRRHEATAGLNIPPADASDEDLRACIVAAIGLLPRPQRDAVELRFREGLTLAEVALRLGSPTRTAQTWVRRGLAQLRDKLRREGHVLGMAAVIAAIPPGTCLLAKVGGGAGTVGGGLAKLGGATAATGALATVGGGALVLVASAAVLAFVIGGGGSGPDPHPRPAVVGEAPASLATTGAAVAGGRTIEKLATLSGHEQDNINDVAIAADGALLASAGTDGTARLWDPRAGKLVRTLRGHAGAVRCVALALDAKRVASGGDDGSVRVWDVADGRQLALLNGHTRTVWAVAFSPQGMIASGSDDFTIRLWNADGGEHAVLDGHGDCVRDVAFSPDGGLIASVANDATLRIWRVADGAQVASFSQPSELTGCGFSPDGSLIACSGFDRVVTVRSLADGAVVRRFSHDHTVNDLAFTLDGLAIIAGDDAGLIRLWSVGTGELLGEHRMAREVVCLAAAGGLIASGDWGRTLELCAMR